MVSVQAQIEIKGDLSLTSLSRELAEVNIPATILKSALIKLQDELVMDLCGPKYERNPDREVIRAGTTSRTLWTRHGKIELRVFKVHDLRNDCYFRPLLVYVGVLPKQKIVDDLVLECAELATYLTYRDSKTVIESLTNVEVSRCRIHGCVQRVGAFMDEERRKASVKDQDLILGDGTKCHGLSGKKNVINVVLGKN